jgi:hypothetical protein
MSGPGRRSRAFIIIGVTGVTGGTYVLLLAANPASVLMDFVLCPEACVSENVC